MTSEQAKELQNVLRNVSAIGKEALDRICVVAESALTVFVEDKRLSGIEHENQQKVKAGLLTRKELAEMLGISERSVSDLQSDGMPCIRFNKSVRFDYQQVMEWTQDKKIRGRGKSKLRMVA